MDDELEPRSVAPLLSKSDRFDSFMKYIAGKANLSRWSNYISSFGRKKREGKPLNFVLLDSHTKCSLLDRIESLEGRLVQLSLEIESRRTSRMSTTTSTSSGVRAPVSSYPIFNNNPKPRCISQYSSQIPVNDTNEVQKKSEKKMEKKKKKAGGGNTKQKKTGKNGMIRQSWPHLRILGC